MFAQIPQLGKDLVWIVDELLRIVQHSGSLSLTCRAVAGTDNCQILAVDSTHPHAGLDLTSRASLYLFRPMLARIAKLSADETGTPFEPYGGRYTLIRSSHAGPVRLDIDFTNTPASQRLEITRTPIAVTPWPHQTTSMSAQAPAAV